MSDATPAAAPPPGHPATPPSAVPHEVAKDASTPTRKAYRVAWADRFAFVRDVLGLPDHPAAGGAATAARTPHRSPDDPRLYAVGAEIHGDGPAMRGDAIAFDHAVIAVTYADPMAAWTPDAGTSGTETPGVPATPAGPSAGHDWRPKHPEGIAPDPNWRDAMTRLPEGMGPGVETPTASTPAQPATRAPAPAPTAPAAHAPPAAQSPPTPPAKVTP